MSSPALTRKRSRAQLLDQDELSTETSTPTSTPPFASIKRRKLNSAIISPAVKLASYARKIGSLFDFPRTEKENIEVPESGDELADKNIWDIPDEEEQTGAKRRKNTETSCSTSTPKKTLPTPKAKGGSKASHKKNVPVEEPEDVWEVPEEEPAITRNSSRRAPKSIEKKQAVADPAPESRSEVIVRRPIGRPRKSQILKEDKKLSNKARRENLRLEDEEEDEEQNKEVEVVEEAPKSVERHKSRVVQEEDVENDSIPKIQVTSTVKAKRGRPKAIRDETLGVEKGTPRGILTPSKKKRGRPRKNVVFEEGPEVELGFKDIPATSSHKKDKQVQSSKAAPEHLEVPSKNNTPKPKKAGKGKVVPAAKEDVDSEDEDDVACGVCSGLDSKKKNPILLCDGCDFAVHKDCYQIAKVPKGDWFCRTCQPDTSIDLQVIQLEQSLPEKVVSPDTLGIDGFEAHLQRMQQIILQKLTGQKRIKIQGHDEVLQKVHQVVEQTILAGEGNSMLIIGARGCGKTTLVESVISELSSEHRDSFHVVRLNGFIHTDDKLALKETWRQLGREMEVDDDLVGKTSNYADTLTSLLALLSHPSELAEDSEDQIAKSVVFVLDEFDLFTTHPRQTLLYNLFDIAQARKAPIVVLGLTTRINVAESLEKRVKSRFSHRYVHLSLPKSLPAFWDICKEALTIDTEELDGEGFDTGMAGQDEFLAYWQSMIEGLFNKDPVFKRYIQSHFCRTKSVAGFLTSCLQPVLGLSPQSLPLTGKTFTANSLSLAAPDSKLNVIQGLSELELALLIAAARLDVILDTDTCNFAMAYDEYSSLTSRHKIQTSSTGVTALGAGAKVWGREVALGAWERLANYELLVPAGIGGGSYRESGAAGRMWKIDVGLEEITGSAEGLSTIMAKWCREI